MEIALPTKPNKQKKANHEHVNYYPECAFGIILIRLGFGTVVNLWLWKRCRGI